jgi:hypothetical protein
MPFLESADIVKTLLKPNSRGNMYFITCTVCAVESSEEHLFKTSIWGLG